MGTRSTGTLTEIDEIRARLDRNVSELERRLPAPARLLRWAVGAAVGGGIGGSLLWFAVRRLRPARPSREQAAPAVVVNLNAKGIVPVAVAAAAAWAGIRLYELRTGRERAADARRGLVASPN